jgi:nitrogen fixation protein NifU and related proteins
MDLYHPLILQHNESPYHYRKAEEADAVIEAYNPLCGDRFTIFLKIENGKVQEACFHGYGCAVSKASTSILVERMEGLNWDEILILCDEFFSFVDPQKEPPREKDEEFAAFSAVRRFPGRMACATLAWEKVKEYPGRKN